MPPVSKIKLNKKIEEKVYDILLDSILKLKNHDEVIEFLADILTPSERVMIAKRLSVAILLAKDYTYESIMDIMKVSKSTVNSVKNVLQDSGDGYQKVIDRLMKKEKVKNLFLMIEEILDIVPATKDFSAWGKRKWERKMEKQEPF